MGAPIGNRNAAKAKAWGDALRWALKTYEGGGVKKGQALRRIAGRLVERALAGDLAAIQEIGNRLDGKPSQPMSTPEDQPFTIVFDDATMRPEGYRRRSAE